MIRLAPNAKLSPAAVTETFGILGMRGKGKELRDIIKRPEYCLAPETQILMEDGEAQRPIGDLACGDRVRSFKPGRSRPEEVTAEVLVTRRLQRPCRRVELKTPTGRISIVASDDHLWLAGGSESFLRYWVQTRNLVLGDELVLRDQDGGPTRVAVFGFEPLGIQDVCGVQTSTGTFFAERVFSHNCTFYKGAPFTAWQAMSEDLRRFHAVKTGDEKLITQLHDGGTIEVIERILRDEGIGK